MPVPATNLPNKSHFRIGEVARLAGVEPYVLRFWETEFSMLRPVKSSTGQRLYRRREVELVLQIRSLLYDEGFTIAGARRQIQEIMQATPVQAPLPLTSDPAPQQDHLRQIRDELRELLALLNQPK